MINYFGSEEGQGFVTYVNGEVVRSQRDAVTPQTREGNGRIVIGRLYTEIDVEYTSMDMDELLFFNTYLTDYDIDLLYNF